MCKNGGQLSCELTLRVAVRLQSVLLTLAGAALIVPWIDPKNKRKMATERSLRGASPLVNGSWSDAVTCWAARPAGNVGHSRGSSDTLPQRAGAQTTVSAFRLSAVRAAVC